MRALGRMRRAGHDTIWGPGRHGPGGNVFCYFIDPAGNVIEYTAELIELTETGSRRPGCEPGERRCLGYQRRHHARRHCAR